MSSAPMISPKPRRPTRCDGNFVDRIFAVDASYTLLHKPPTLEDPYYYFSNREGTHYTHAHYAPFDSSAVDTLRRVLGDQTPAAFRSVMTCKGERYEDRLVFGSSVIGHLKGLDQDLEVQVGAQNNLPYLKYRVGDIVNGTIGLSIPQTPVRVSTPIPSAPATPFCYKAEEWKRTTMPINDDTGRVYIDLDDIKILPRVVFTTNERFGYSHPDAQVGGPEPEVTMTKDEEDALAAAELSPWVIESGPIVKASSLVSTTHSSVLASSSSTEETPAPAMDFFASAKKAALAKAARNQAAQPKPAQDPTPAAVTTLPRHASNFFAMCNNGRSRSASSADSDNEDEAEYEYDNASDATVEDVGTDSDLKVDSVGQKDVESELDGEAGDAGIKRELYDVPILHYLGGKQ